MSQLHLTFSLCKDCGECCFNCDHLDYQTGCTNMNYRFNSRCTSFPVIYGIPSLMGHENIYGKILEEIDRKIWFIFGFQKCLLQQKELFFNNLRWFLEDLNNGSKVKSFFVSFEDVFLAINVDL